MGGLAMAGRLARAGYAVTLLEKNETVGGRLQSFNPPARSPYAFISLPFATAAAAPEIRPARAPHQSGGCKCSQPRHLRPACSAPRKPPLPPDAQDAPQWRFDTGPSLLLFPKKCAAAHIIPLPLLPLPLAPGSPTPRRAAATTKFHVPPENLRRYEECFEALGQNIEDHVTIKRARNNLAPPRRRPSRPTAAPPPACLLALPHRLSAVCCPAQVDPAYRAHFGDGTSFDLVYDMLRFREQARVWRISAWTDWPARLQGRHALQSKPSRPLKPRKPCLRRLCPAARAKVRPLASAGGGAGAGSGGTLL